MKIVAITPNEWKALSEDAFQIVFKGRRSAAKDRISFALLMVDEETNTPLGYLTAREMDAEDLCWEYGGAFPEKANSPHVLHGYMMFARWCQTRYRRVFQVVENKNHRYLRLAMKLGFNIIGVRAVGGETLVEMLLEFPDAVS